MTVEGGNREGEEGFRRKVEEDGRWEEEEEDKETGI